ncbi:MAG: AMP-binding protein [Actinomycetota bacterium]|nr:AMP-binding protein [Actinomycetota bacterium]
MTADGPSHAAAPEPRDRGVGGGQGVRAILERQAARLGPRPLLVLPETTLTYADTDEVANRAAEALRQLGVDSGSTVMAFCGNGLPMAATWFACMKLGAVFMPVNSLLEGDPLRNVMAHAGARVLVCDAALYPEVAAIRRHLPHLRHVLVAGAPLPGTMSLETCLERASSAPPPPLADDPGAPAKLVYTSGTTGTSKGVIWSRACELTWAHCYTEELLHLTEDDATYCCLPLCHVTCQGTTLATLVAGGTITIDDRFRPFGFWDRVRRAEAQVFTFVGTILSTLVRLPAQADDADNPVRLILGSATPADRWREIEDRFDLSVMDVWGQTETASCWTRPEQLPQRPGTVGRPSPRFEAKIVDETGNEMPPDAVGEMWIRPLRSHVMFEGYRRPDGSVAAQREADGWYRTGDLMVRRGDGDFSFIGRLRDAIRRRGEMISAADVETAALAHPAVLEVAAVGVPAEEDVEEEIKLSVVLRRGAALEPEALHGFLVDRLPLFMVPRYVDVRAGLPKTATTRVQRFRLKEEGTAGTWDARHPRSTN